MASQSDIEKLGRISAVSTNPVPDIYVPEMPAKLVKIDPDGCAVYTQEVKKALQDFVQKLNVLTQATNQQIQDINAAIKKLQTP